MRGDIGQKSNGYIAKTAYVAAASVVEALADGSLSQADVSVAEALQLTPSETDCPPADEGGELGPAGRASPKAPGPLLS